MAVKHKAVKAKGETLKAEEWNQPHDAPLSALDDVEITTPANGEVLTYESATAKWKNKPAPVGAVDRLTLIKEITVASDTNTIDITGLDINTHKIYIIVIKRKYVLNISDWVYMYVEGDYLDTNYYSQFFYASGTSIGGNRQNNPRIANASMNAFDMYIIDLSLIDTLARAVSRQTLGAGGGLAFYQFSWSYVTSITNITSIRLYGAGGANVFGAGTKVEVYGYKSA